jgi:hypothetical protein
MKRFTPAVALILCAVMAMPMLNSCKKGEEDPFLSLKSRKSRLSGEWKLTDGTQTVSSASATITYTYNGASVTSSLGGSSPYTETLVFNKDNTFKFTITDDDNLEVTEGFWTFVEGYDEIKDKEMVLLQIGKRTITVSGNTSVQNYTGSQMDEAILKFKRLASKDCIIADVGSKSTGSVVASFTMEMKYEKQ